MQKKSGIMKSGLDVMPPFLPDDLLSKWYDMGMVPQYISVLITKTFLLNCLFSPEFQEWSRKSIEVIKNKKDWDGRKGGNDNDGVSGPAEQIGTVAGIRSNHLLDPTLTLFQPGGSDYWFFS